MQQTGTLKKRRRRNLAKVNGIGIVPYDENEDNFTGTTSQKPFTEHTDEDIRLRMSSNILLLHRREETKVFGSQMRVTRDPSYHDGDLDNDYSYLDDDTGAEDFVRLGPFEKRANLSESIQNRKYWLDKHSMQRLKQLLWLGITSGALPWYWNDHTGRVDEWRPIWKNLWKLLWFLFNFQSGCLSVFQLYGFVHSLETSTKTNREMFMGLTPLLFTFGALLFNVNMYIYKDPMRQYINAMLKFNQEYTERFLIHLDGFKDGGRPVINFVFFTNYSQVFNSVCFFLAMPYQPCFLFSFIHPKPWYWLIPGVIHEFMVSGQVITGYLLLPWIAVVHTNTLRFWLEECHNHNDSDYTTDELRFPKTSIETYKALLILNKVFNSCMSPFGIPVLKFHISFALVVTGYMLIRSMNHVFIEEFPGIMVYPLAILNCATAAFVIMNQGGRVFDLGCSFIDSWSRTKHKDFRRILMSCPAIKVWVGRFYFITAATTVTLFKVIFDYVTDCIIAFPG